MGGRCLVRNLRRAALQAAGAALRAGPGAPERRRCGANRWRTDDTARLVGPGSATVYVGRRRVCTCRRRLLPQIGPGPARVCQVHGITFRGGPAGAVCQEAQDHPATPDRGARPVPAARATTSLCAAGSARPRPAATSRLSRSRSGVSIGSGAVVPGALVLPRSPLSPRG